MVVGDSIEGGARRGLAPGRHPGPLPQAGEGTVLLEKKLAPRSTNTVMVAGPGVDDR